MKNRFRNNPDLVSLLNKIDNELGSIRKDGKRLNIMEICGTHTVSILKHGFRNYFHDRINFLSGPGCPVCVTAQEDIEKVIRLAQMGYRIVTFGDLIKVPGYSTSLEEEISKGAKVDVVYNPLESIEIASKTKDEIIFVAIGFETTIPLIASLIQDIYEQKINNLSICNFVKTIPAILKFLLSDKDLKIDGFICPGHVSVIIGEKPYNIIAQKNNIPSVIAGFEPVDIGLALESLISQIKSRKPFVDNKYKRMVKSEGNVKAKKLISSVFEETDAKWRGFSLVPASGLKLREKYQKYNAESRFNLKVEECNVETGCICSEIIAGKKQPFDCRLFRKKCTPDSPIGPCMVSVEGACSAYYKYGDV